MSHVSYIDLQVSDLNALAKAAEACGLKLVRDQTSIRWYGSWQRDYHDDDAAYKHGIAPDQYGKCAHAIVIPGLEKGDAYDIGILDNGDGTYKIYYDHWGPGGKLIELIGRNGEKLKQHYVKEVTCQVLKKKGFKLDKEDLTANLNLKLTLKGPVSL